MAYFGIERYKDALTTFKLLLDRAKKGEYDILRTHLCLAMTYAMLDQEEDARIQITNALKIDPDYTIKRFSAAMVYKNQTDADRIIHALIKAGLPE